MTLQLVRAAMRVAGAGLALVVAGATPALAQIGRTTILVGAGDVESGQFLRGVEVDIPSLNVAAVTDSMGQARFRGVRAGTYTIEARRIGYQPISTPLLVRSEDSVEVVLLMRSAPTALDTVKVTRAAVSMRLREFEDRRQKGFGHFITAAQMDSATASSLDVIIESHIPGVRVTGNRANGMHVMSLRAEKRCDALVYLDGVRVTDGDISLVDQMNIGGIEYYTASEIPVEYKAPASILRSRIDPGSNPSPACGAMMIWSRP